MGAALVVAAPLILTIGTCLATMYCFAPRGDALAGTRIADRLLVGDLAIFALGWALIWAAPDSRTADGEICKDFGDFDAFFYPVVFGSAILGGLAWGMAGLQRDAGYGKLLAYAAVAICVPYAIAIRALFATACFLD